MKQLSFLCSLINENLIEKRLLLQSECPLMFLNKAQYVGSGFG